MAVFIRIPFLLGLLAPLLLLLSFDEFLDIGNPLALVVIGLPNELLLGFLIDVHEHQSVLDQVELDKVVQGRISRKTGRVVDLQHVGVQTLVNHHIDAQDMEAHVAVLVVGLGELVLVADQGLPDHHRLHQHVVQLLLEGAQVEAPPLHVLVD